MTSERIAEARRTSGYAQAEMGNRFVIELGEIVQQLLDERQALLDALKEAVAMVDSQKYVATVAVLLGAVAKAELP
jgi:hypothetical protein